MGKISLKPYNDYCPQTLFLYGTYDETCKHYFSYEGKDLGAWGEPGKALKG